jgi:AhpD family alkylhydroperoxidase
MTTRIEDRGNLMGAVQAMLGLEGYVRESGLETQLLDLVRLRASQMNGCAFCLSMHTRDLLALGERPDRIAVLPAWRESDWFTDRERAALAWTEALTDLSSREVPDAVFDQARSIFSEKELADLSLAVVAINGWNRLNVGFQNPPDPFPSTLKQPAMAQ